MSETRSAPDGSAWPAPIGVGGVSSRASLDLSRLKHALDGAATHTCSIMRPAHSGDRQSVARANG
jgi:hypothetical protein